jgi:predicted SAM-dependent methyltransferase
MLPMKILNLAGGKLPPISLPPKFKLLNLDKSYFSEVTPIAIEDWMKYSEYQRNEEYFLNYDAFEFLERTTLKFDIICIYRFLEHISKINVLYFIYLLSNCLQVGGVIDVIVPDAKKLAKMIIEEDVNAPDWESKDLLITYEMVADQPSPHLSLWTKDRLIKLFAMEGNFEATEVTEDFSFDGRNIYVRYEGKKIR